MDKELEQEANRRDTERIAGEALKKILDALVPVAEAKVRLAVLRSASVMSFGKDLEATDGSKALDFRSLFFDMTEEKPPLANIANEALPKK